MNDQQALTLVIIISKELAGTAPQIHLFQLLVQGYFTETLSIYYIVEVHYQAIEVNVFVMLWYYSHN